MTGVGAAQSMDAPVSSVMRASMNSVRRRRVKRSWIAAETFVFDNLPAHQKDNQFIRRYYRANYGVKQSLWSLFSLHNETGNIWTHVIGMIIFVCLIWATARMAPAQLSLSSGRLAALEERLYAVGKSNLLELVQAVGSWEAAAVRAGQSGVEGVEEALRSLVPGNLQELTEIQSALRRVGARGVRELSALGRLLGRVSRDSAAELAGLEARLAGLGPRAVREADVALQRALAAALGSEWPARRWPVYVFVAGAIACLATSAACHLLGCCAAHIATRVWRADYAGIAVLIVTSFYPPVYYGFACAPRLRALYLVLTTALGVAALAVALLPFFQKPSYHTVRAATFSALGLWGVVPLLHAAALNGAAPEPRAALALDVAHGALYLAGAALYALRVPERWAPGKFDMLGHSHQLFHVLVVVAACLHYRATRILMHWRDATGGCIA